MARHDIDFSELLDVARLKAGCKAIIKDGNRPQLELRSALLPVLRRASVEGREKARELQANDGSGLACARRISWLQDQIISVL